MMEVKIGIIGAMDEEILYLKNAMEEMREENGIFFGKISGKNVILARSGIGKVNAALCADRLIREHGATHVINTGIAGAMKKGLRVLDFVASTDALYHDFDVTGFGYEPTVIPRMEKSAFPADENLLCAVQEAFLALSGAEPFLNHNLVLGRIASGDQFISNREAKERIQTVCSPSCVEMEGAAIAHACFLNKTPFLILRCMSDMADDGEEESYKFNDKIAAEMSARLVEQLITKI